MKIKEAIEKIKEMGFNANYWAKGDKQRIYIEFRFNGSHRSGGYVCKDESYLKAEACGKKTKRYQDLLDEVATWKIEWNEESSTGKTISHREAASRAAKEMEIDYREFGIGL